MPETRFAGLFLMLGVGLFGFIAAILAWAILGYPLWHDYLVPLYQLLHN